jgi:hypothetical protein
LTFMAKTIFGIAWLARNFTTETSEAPQFLRCSTSFSGL